MHEYRRFIQSELDARGWRQADLVRKSGLSRQLVSNIVRDNRPHLGQMPDEETMAGIATGFGIPVERVRTAAARSLIGYEDDGTALTITLGDVSTDALLNEIRRRINEHQQPATDPVGSPAAARASSTEDEKTGKPDDLSQRRASRGAYTDRLDMVAPPPEVAAEWTPEELPEHAWAARTRDPRFKPDIPDNDGAGEESDPDGPEGGA